MDASEQRPFGLPREFAQFFHPPWWHRPIVGIPWIDSVDPLEGDVGTEVTIRGGNLTGLRVSFDGTRAPILREGTDEVIVAVPAAYGDQRVTVQNALGEATATQPFHVVGGQSASCAAPTPDEPGRGGCDAQHEPGDERLPTGLPADSCAGPRRPVRRPAAVRRLPTQRPRAWGWPDIATARPGIRRSPPGSPG